MACDVLGSALATLSAEAPGVMVEEADRLASGPLTASGHHTLSPPLTYRRRHHPVPSPSASYLGFHNVLPAPTFPGGFMPRAQSG